MSLRDALQHASAVAVTGSRRITYASMRVNLTAALAMIPEKTPILVGCADGVDQTVRLRCPSAVVFHAARFAPGRLGLVRRSQYLAETIARSPGGVLLALPSVACPADLLPCSNGRKCFFGHGSGTWGTLAYAVGLGATALVWLPSTIDPPTAPGWKLRWMQNDWFIIAPDGNRIREIL